MVVMVIDSNNGGGGCRDELVVAMDIITVMEEVNMVATNSNS